MQHDLKDELDRLISNDVSSATIIDNLENQKSIHTKEVKRLEPICESASKFYEGHKNMISEFGRQISDYYSSIDDKNKREHNIVINFDEVSNSDYTKLRKIKEFGGRKNSGIRTAIREYNSLVDKIPSAYTEYESLKREINIHQDIIRKCVTEIYRVEQKEKSDRIQYLKSKIKEEEEASSSTSKVDEMRAFLTGGIREMPRSSKSNFIPNIEEINAGNLLIENVVNSFTNDPDETIDIEGLFIEGDEDDSDDIKLTDDETDEELTNVIPVSLDDLK